jgi:hypothetical protein
MRFSRGLFQETIHALSVNWLVALTFLATGMVLQALDKTLGNAGLFAQLILISVLAICIHRTIMKPDSRVSVSTKIWMIWSYGWRWVAMLALSSVIGVIPVYVLGYLFLISAGPIEAYIGLSGVLVTIVFASVLSKWGTFLPAVAVEGDSSFAGASVRGRRTFGYSAMRLFFCCGPLLIVPYALTLFRMGKFGAIDSSVIGKPMEYGLPLLFVWLLQLLFALFSTALIATILSRAYLIGEAKENSLIA